MPDLAPRRLPRSFHYPVVMSVYVFIYGSLRAGEINDLAVAAARHGCPPPVRVGQASLPGRLYDMGDYPAMTAGGPGRVQGDVYAVDSCLLAVMDEIEEYVPGTDCTFLRTEAEVEVNGRRLACQYYPVPQHKLGDAPAIEAEDWVAYRRARDQARAGRTGSS